MDISELMKGLLGRSLDDEEQSLLRQLTVQGMAKVNADLARDVMPEVTMADLRDVYRGLLVRRQTVVSSLPQLVRIVVSRMNYAVSTDEMVFLTDCCHSGKLFRALLDKNGRLAKNFDLQSSTEVHFQNQLAIEAQTLAQIHHHTRSQSLTPPPTRVIQSNLVAVAAPATLTSPILLRRDGNRVTIGVNPVSNWFNECAVEPLKISKREAIAVLSSFRKRRQISEDLTNQHQSTTVATATIVAEHPEDPSVSSSSLSLPSAAVFSPTSASSSSSPMGLSSSWDGGASGASLAVAAAMATDPLTASCSSLPRSLGCSIDGDAVAVVGGGGELVQPSQPRSSSSPAQPKLVLAPRVRFQREEVNNNSAIDTLNKCQPEIPCSRKKMDMVRHWFGRLRSSWTVSFNRVQPNDNQFQAF